MNTAFISPMRITKALAAFLIGMYIGSVTAPVAIAENTQPERRGIPMARYKIAPTMNTIDESITAFSGDVQLSGTYMSSLQIQQHLTQEATKKSVNTELPEQYTDFIVPKHVIYFAKEYTQSADTLITPPDIIDKVVHKVQDKTLQRAGISELIAVSAQQFVDYNPDRKHNIIRGLQAFDGRIILPGETLSFNETIGEVSIATDFKRTKIIRNGREVTGVGGGVCQVSTGVFQTAWAAGLEINERRNHSLYYPDFYTAGTDATTAYNSPDLVFTNTTKNPIMMQFVQEDDWLITLLYGTREQQVTLKQLWNSVTKWGGGSTAWERTMTNIHTGETQTETFESYYKPMA